MLHANKMYISNINTYNMKKNGIFFTRLSVLAGIGRAAERGGEGRDVWGQVVGDTITQAKRRTACIR